MDYGGGQCSDPGAPLDAPDSSSSVNPRALSDDEVILASCCPKKRAGRKKFKETRHPVYRGVRLRNGNRWVCEVRTPNNKSSRIWLGTYPTAEMAARAHDVAALALRGRAACLNFADSAWRLPVPTSTDSREIQRAAAEAAEAFRPPDESEEYCSMQENDDRVSRTENAMRSNDEVLPQNVAGYMDEEAVFDMPRLLDNMAEGLLLPPPESGGLSVDDTESECEVSLWSYSI